MNSLGFVRGAELLRSRDRMLWFRCEVAPDASANAGVFRSKIVRL